LLAGTDLRVRSILKLWEGSGMNAVTDRLCTGNLLPFLETSFILFGVTAVSGTSTVVDSLLDCFIISE
jgi:hypothetical protein